MKQEKYKHCVGKQSEMGFTMLELLVACILLSLLTMLTIPYYSQWQKDGECRAAARDIVSLLREARTRAIAMNREHRVEFEDLCQRYGLRGGDKADKSNWSSIPPVQDWKTYKTEVQVKVNVHSIQFNTNGTANGGTVTVRSTELPTKIEIVITRTGRIRLQHSS